MLNQNYTKNKTNNSKVSKIYLGKCEQLLKEANKIPSTESLIIYKTFIKSEDLSSTYIQYEVYRPLDLKKLDLSKVMKLK